MGSNSSKEASANQKTNSRSKTASPKQEKHNSADSKTPLTGAPPGFSIPASSSLNQHSTTATTSPPQSRYEAREPTTISIDEQEGHSDVTRPPAPPRLRRLSELIDPNELTIDSHVRSPSGNLLAVEQFITHPSRPKSIRERQEQIRERVRAVSRLGQEVEVVGNEKAVESEVRGEEKVGGMGRWLVCGCFGRS